MYKHTQRGDVIIISMVVGGLITFFSTIWFGPLIAFASTASIVGLLALFCTLTVTVDGETISARFGPGLIGFSWSRADVLKAEAAETPWYFGWGIRYFGDGWLYNVSGLESVELTLTSGKKVRIGTDDVPGLLAAIDAG